MNADFYDRFDAAQTKSCLDELEPVWQREWIEFRQNGQRNVNLLAQALSIKAGLSLRMGCYETCEAELLSVFKCYGWQSVAQLTSFLKKCSACAHGSQWLLSAFPVPDPLIFEMPFGTFVTLVLLFAESRRASGHPIAAANVLDQLVNFCALYEKIPWQRMYESRDARVLGWTGLVRSTLVRVANVAHIRASHIMATSTTSVALGLSYLDDTIQAMSISLACLSYFSDLGRQNSCVLLARHLEVDTPQISKIARCAVENTLQRSTAHLLYGDAASTLMANCSTLGAKMHSLVCVKNNTVVTLCCHATQVARALELAWRAAADVLNLVLRKNQGTNAGELIEIVGVDGGRKQCAINCSLVRNLRLLNYFLPNAATADATLQQQLILCGFNDRELLVKGFCNDAFVYTHDVESGYTPNIAAGPRFC